LSAPTTEEGVRHRRRHRCESKSTTTNRASKEVPTILDVGNASQKNEQDEAGLNPHSARKRKAPENVNEEATVVASKGPSSPKKRRRTFTSTNKLVTSRTADKVYKKRFDTAMKNKVVNMVTSGFEQHETLSISKLCKTKLSNGVKLKLKDSIDAGTTVCVLPTAYSDVEEATCRTLKAIRCALLGIPMVPLAWVEHCQKERKISIPKNYIRTLASKTAGTAETMKDYASYGVARLAAARSNEPHETTFLFQNTSVFLCGTFSSNKKQDIVQVLEEGSATLVTTLREASARLKSVADASSEPLTLPTERFVLLLGDRGKAIPRLLQKETKAALEETRSRNVYVVDSGWVSLSVACASMLPPSDFKPKIGVDLWELSKEFAE